MRDEQLAQEKQAAADQKRIDGIQQQLTMDRVNEEIRLEDEKNARIRQMQIDHQAKVQAENKIDQERRRLEKIRLIGTTSIFYFLYE